LSSTGDKDHPASSDATTTADQDYRAALAAARMGAWETNLATKTRRWSPEAMKLFGFDLPDGLGTVGGDNDEYLAALHPDDRHLRSQFHQIAHTRDFYEGEYRIVRPDGAVRWVTGRALVVEREPDGRARRTVTVVTDITEQKENEEHVRFLLRELSHRSKNLIAVIQGIAHRTVRTAVSLQDFEARFNRRLTALAASHNVLINQDWKAAPLDALIREQLTSFTEGDASRVAVQGPPILVNANSAQLIGLAIHELATNAVKHGALALPAGRVSITWNGPDEKSLLDLHWHETDGPPVAAPTRTGFGHTVIKDMIARGLDANVEMNFARTGLSWRAHIPIAALLSDTRS
jgi:PAS domain S-box-containing protein